MKPACVLDRDLVAAFGIVDAIALTDGGLLQRGHCSGDGGSGSSENSVMVVVTKRQ